MADLTRFYLAMVGGIADPAFAMVTTGDIWGGAVDIVGNVWGGSFSTTGDIVKGSTTVSNLVNADQLVVGLTYDVFGTGIPQYGAFTYAGGNSAILNLPATETQAGASLVLRNEPQRTIVSGLLGAGLAQLVVGDSYTLGGSGIPAGTSFTYEGTDSVDISQPATQTSRFTALSAGTTTGRYVVQNLGTTVGLVVGQTYWIAGAGIPANDFFLYEGGASVTLNQPATLSSVGAYLAIRKGITEDDGGPFDAGVHLVEDYKIVSLDIEQNEGDFATLHADVRNPQVGLIAPARKWWCWLSWDRGDGTVIPLFHGRLVGVPLNLTNEVATLEFVARPADYAEQKAALAAELQVAPYWDPLWLQNGIDNPDTVLEARSALWHIDRVSLEVSASDILEAEDGTITVDESGHFYDSLSLGYSEPALVSVTVSATVEWQQQGEGEVDLTDAFVTAFAAQGSPFEWPVVGSYTGDGLLSSWPKPEAGLGGGWSMATDAVAVAADWQPVGRYQVRYSAKGGSLTTSMLPADSQNKFQEKGTSSLSPFENPAIGGITLFSGYEDWLVQFSLSPIFVNFLARYVADRHRSETVFFTLAADVQSLLVDPNGSDSEVVTLSSAFLEQPIDEDGGLPIVDVRRNAFFPTDRGQQALQYLMVMAAAKLRAKARAVEISFDAPWLPFAEVSCRQAILLTDRRLPGGQAAGKIKSYRLHADGDGNHTANITFGCAIGRGIALPAPAAGEHDYSDDYADDYDQVVGGGIAVVPGELHYTSLDGTYAIDDDGVDLFSMTPGHVIASLEIIDGPNAQRAAIDEAAKIQGDPVQGLASHPTVVDLKMVPVVGGDFVTQYAVTLSNLVIPKTIDLEAA
jgi:hypothetical protein